MDYHAAANIHEQLKIIRANMELANVPHADTKVIAPDLDDTSNSIASHFATIERFHAQGLCVFDKCARNVRG